MNSLSLRHLPCVPERTNSVIRVMFYHFSITGLFNAIAVIDGILVSLLQ
jgi:hypothetical protein